MVVIAPTNMAMHIIHFFIPIRFYINQIKEEGATHDTLFQWTYLKGASTKMNYSSSSASFIVW